MTLNDQHHRPRAEARSPFDPATTALFIDFDGTLVDIAETPDAVAVPDDLVPLLSRLQANLGGAMAIVTGRLIADIDRMIAPLRLVVAGVHGADLRVRADGADHLVAPPITPRIASAVARLAETVDGLQIETKGAAIALHYRAVPAAAPFLEAELRQILTDAGDDLVLTRGRRVLELVPRSVSKGAALAAILALPTFQGRVPIMIGDDVSDESAFAMAEQLGGIALRVAGEHFTQELADFDGPQQVRSWLSSLFEKARV